MTLGVEGLGNRRPKFTSNKRAAELRAARLRAYQS